MRFKKSLKHFVIAACLIRATGVSAQSNPNWDLRITLGWRTTVADGTCDEGQGRFFRSGQFEFGGSARYYVASRLSVGPELSFVIPCKRETYTYYHPRLVGKLSGGLDLNHSSKVQPYLVGSFGIVRSITSTAKTVHYSWEGTGGLGARLFVSDQTFMAPEAYLGGMPPIIRFSSSIGTLLEKE